MANVFIRKFHEFQECISAFRYMFLILQFYKNLLRFRCENTFKFSYIANRLRMCEPKWGCEFSIMLCCFNYVPLLPLHCHVSLISLKLINEMKCDTTNLQRK